MIEAFIITSVLSVLLWLLSIRPYCREHGSGYMIGTTIGSSLWADWQVAKKTAKDKGDDGMILICRLFFWLQLAAGITLVSAIVYACGLTK